MIKALYDPASSCIVVPIQGYRFVFLVKFEPYLPSQPLITVFHRFITVDISSQNRCLPNSYLLPAGLIWRILWMLLDSYEIVNANDQTDSNHK
jgi:hypothetical protein